MQDVGAKVGQLPRLVVRQRLEAHRLLHLAGIRGEDAVDVGPDRDRLGDEHGAEDRGGVVGAVALQRRGNPLRGSRDEPSGDQDPVSARFPVAPRVEQLVEVGVRSLVVHVHAAVFGVGDDENVARVDPLRVEALAADHGGAQARGPELAVAHDEVGKGLGGGSRDGHGAEHGSEVLELRHEVVHVLGELLGDGEERLGGGSVLVLELDEFLLVRGVARGGHVGGVDEAVGHLGLAFGGDAHGGDDAEGLHAGLGGLDEEIAHAGDALEGADAGSAELVHLVAGSALDAAHAAGRGGGLGDGGSRGRGADARGLDNLRDPGGITARKVGSALGEHRPKLSDGGGHGSGDRRIGRRVVGGARFSRGATPRSYGRRRRVMRRARAELRAGA